MLLQAWMVKDFLISVWWVWGRRKRGKKKNFMTLLVEILSQEKKKADHIKIFK